MRHNSIIPDAEDIWERFPQGPGTSSILYQPNLVLGLTSRETADLTKKSHDVGRDVLGKPGITKRIFVESHDVGRDVLGLKGLMNNFSQRFSYFKKINVGDVRDMT
ncbi:unnamed protein product [Meganyctiphanes norvegica]|uniref:Uncharacterized protein n=1 Tax=Meganyctiphanes norvegica TaxID=48144 RepID=A0AAV2Q2G4_MEGNR